VPSSDLQLAAKRNKMIEAIIPDLKTIAHLRRAYMLKEWKSHFAAMEIAKAADPLKPLPKVLDVERYRTEIGVKLGKALRAVTQEPSPSKQKAVAMLIAGMAADEPVYTRTLTDVVRDLLKAKDTAVRQAALNALGKITPDPADAFPLLQDTLKKDEVGPRRLAAYALSDLVRNSRALQKTSEKLDTIDRAIGLAAGSLDDADDWVRGYCLQAIQESARAIAEHYSSAAELTAEERKALRPALQKTFKIYQAANPALVKALGDLRPNVRLAALQTVDQIGTTRAKIIQTLREINPDRRERSVETLKAFEVPDPLIAIVGKDLKAVTRFLKDDDVRFRRGAIEFLEQLGDQAETALGEVTEALRDSDAMVRWSAARTVRYIPGDKVGAEAIRLLGTMLIDPDPDLGRAAAAALEGIGPAAQDAVDWLAFVIANGDTDSRNWDTENRVAAMNALVSIGSPAAHRAIPKLLVALADSDVRLRREAAYTLGQIGRPADASYFEQELEALQKAMSDEDPEVRINASEAILSIDVMRKPL
jgi:HEAT repeat protein